MTRSEAEDAQGEQRPDKLRLRVPLDVLVDEAAVVAGFCRRYWDEAARWGWTTFPLGEYPSFNSKGTERSGDIDDVGL